MTGFDEFPFFFWIHWGGMLLAMVVVWKIARVFFPQQHHWWGRIVVSLAVMTAFVLPTQSWNWPWAEPCCPTMTRKANPKEWADCYAKTHCD